MQTEQQSNTTTSYTTKKRPPKSVIVTALSFVLLISALTVSVALQQNDKKEAASQREALEKRISAIETENKFTEKQVNKDRTQAIFLKGEQVYFGKITAITKDTIKLEDIYYLKVGTVDRTGDATSTDVSLVKLGEEMHGPEDMMIIERNNVLFWENIKNDSEVSKAIAEYKKSGDR